MPLSYSFSLIKLAPRNARDERLNIGVAVLRDGEVDIRPARRLDKVRAISAALDEAAVKELFQAVVGFDKTLAASGLEQIERLEALSELGPVYFSPLGSFEIASPSEYEEAIQRIMRSMVEPEAAPNRRRSKRTRLLTEVKSSLKRERVLAQKGEGISSHRIVSNLEIDDGLVADLALRNGAMHVIETVDAGHEDSLKRAVSEIAVAAFVLESARFKFGTQAVSRLVYSASSEIEHSITPSLDVARSQGAMLYNWSSRDDQLKLVDEMRSLATPLEPKKRKKRVH